MKNGKKLFILDTLVKTLILSKLIYLVLQRKKIYKIDRGYCIFFMSYLWKQGTMYSVTLLLRQQMRMAKFVAGNGCCMRDICKIYEEENTWPIYVHMAGVITHGRPTETLVGGCSTVCLAQFLASLCGIHTSATIQLVLIIDVACGSSYLQFLQHFTHFTTGLTLGPKYHCYTGLVDADFQRSLGRLPLNLFEIIFICWSLRSSISPHIGYISGNSHPLSNLPSVHHACDQFVPHCVSNFNYRVCCDL